jgi:hypothetical protein
MSANQQPTVVTPFFRAAFVNLFPDPKTGGPPVRRGQQGDPKYGVTAIFPAGTDLTGLKQLAQAAGQAKWGDKFGDIIKSPTFKAPFRRAEEKQAKWGDEAFPNGAIFINITTKFLPGIVDANRQPILQASEFYSGCWGRAKVRAFAYDNIGIGISFGLDSIQKVRDDKPFSSRGDAADDFDAIAPEAGGTAAPPAAGNDPLFS